MDIMNKTVLRDVVACSFVKIHVFQRRQAPLKRLRVSTRLHDASS